MKLNFSDCPAADQQDEAKKARTEEFFELAEKDTTTDAHLTELVKQGICLEARDNDGRTALHWATLRGHTATLQALLAVGAEIETRDVWGITALIKAAYWGKTATVHALLAAGAEIEAIGNDGLTPSSLTGWWGWTALICAAGNGKTDTVHALLAAGAEIEARDNDGCTALIKAAYWGKTATLQALLAAGAESEARDHRGRTALHCAADKKKTDTVYALLARGANIYARDNDGKGLIDNEAVSDHVESLQRGYAKFVASRHPPQNAAAVYRLLAATPLLDENAPVDRLGNLTRIMAHAQWVDKTKPAAILSEMAADGSITPEMARSIYQHHIATPAARRTHHQNTGRGR